MEALAERIRPQKLEDYISQSHLVGNGSLTQQIAKELSLPSFYGDREQEKQLWHKS
jgi:replication-associated recombination protein RarA